MSHPSWIIKKGTRHLHGYSIIEGEPRDPKWLNKRKGSLLFTREEARKLAVVFGGVPVKD